MSHASRLTAEAANTAGAISAVARPTATNTRRPMIRDTTLNVGHGTPAMETVASGRDTVSRNCSAVVTKVTIARTEDFGHPKHVLRLCDLAS